MSIKNLLVGDLAPELRVSRFLKGSAFTAFVPGHVYVIELWATWCGPCLESMPHLTELQATYPKVTILGVAVMEKNSDALGRFVAEKADLIGYSIAEDLTSDDAATGWMQVEWLRHSYLGGIPAAFIVDRSGRIAWIGQPMRIDAALAAVVKGEWDLDAQAKAYADALAQSGIRESTALGAAIGNARAAGDLQAALRACDVAFAESPALEAKMCGQKITLLAETERAALAGYARHLADTIDVPNAEIYRSIGMSLYAATQGEEAALDRSVALLARDFMRRAERMFLTGIEPAPFTVAVTKGGLGEILLALNEVEDALAAAASARDWILKVDAPFMVEHIEDLIRRCEGAARIAAPAQTVICDGDTCRIV